MTRHDDLWQALGVLIVAALAIAAICIAGHLWGWP